MENYLFVPKICKSMKSSWAWIIRLKMKWILHLWDISLKYSECHKTVNQENDV